MASAFRNVVNRRKKPHSDAIILGDWIQSNHTSNVAGPPTGQTPNSDQMISGLRAKGTFVPDRSEHPLHARTFFYFPLTFSFNDPISGESVNAYFGLQTPPDGNQEWIANCGVFSDSHLFNITQHASNGVGKQPTESHSRKSLSEEGVTTAQFAIPSKVLGYGTEIVTFGYELEMVEIDSENINYAARISVATPEQPEPIKVAEWTLTLPARFTIDPSSFGIFMEAVSGAAKRNEKNEIIAHTGWGSPFYNGWSRSSASSILHVVPDYKSSDGTWKPSTFVGSQGMTDDNPRVTTSDANLIDDDVVWIRVGIDREKEVLGELVNFDYKDDGSIVIEWPDRVPLSELDPRPVGDKLAEQRLQRALAATGDAEVTAFITIGDTGIRMNASGRGVTIPAEIVKKVEGLDFSISFSSADGTTFAYTNEDVDYTINNSQIVPIPLPTQGLSQ